MQKTLSLLLIIIGLTAVSLIPTCSHYKNDNPFDVLYSDANYVLKAEWKRLPAQLYIDTSYFLPCTTSVGRDSFTMLTIDEVDSGFVDMQSVRSVGFDTLIFSFKKEHRGRLHIAGLRPNGKIKTDSSDELTVANQFKPNVTAASRQTIVQDPDTIAVFIENIKDSIITLFWRLYSGKVSDSVHDTLHSGVIPLSLDIQSGGTNDTLFVWARNFLGYNSDTVKTVLSISKNTPVLHAMALPDTLNCGDTLHVALWLDSAESRFMTIITSADSQYRDTSLQYPYAHNVTVTMRRPLIGAGMMHFSVRLIDFSGAVTPGSLQDSSYVMHTFPALYLQQSLVTPLNDSQQISVIDSHAVAIKYVWKFSSRAADSDVTYSAEKKIYYTSVMTDTVKVYGIDKFGYPGKTVSATISAKNLKYFLAFNEALFPSNITACVNGCRTATFGVAINNPALFASNAGVYFWRIDSMNITIVTGQGRTLSSLSHKFTDSGSYVVSVIARDSVGDSSNRLEKPVFVHTYPPGLKFLKSLDTAAIASSDTVRLKYWDTNPDSSGSVQSIYLDINGQKTVAGANSFFTINYPVMGDLNIRAYVKDSDGFYSSVDSMRLVLIPNQPYCAPARDTSVYIGETLLIKPDFHSGLDKSAIQTYTWLIHGPDAFMLSSTVNTLAYTFTKPGSDTVIVSCMDYAGNSSYRPYKFIVMVTEGMKPAVLGITPDTVWMADDTGYVFNAVLAKNNAPIAVYAVSWDNSNQFEHYSVASFKHKFTTDGVHQIRLQAIDINSKSSDIVMQTIMVRKGKPVVDSMSVNAPLRQLYVSIPQNYTIWSRDTNGIVDSMKVFWTATDSTIVKNISMLSHTFLKTDTGAKTIKVMVRDDDGNWSDTLFQKIALLPYKQRVLLVKTDTNIFVKEMHTYVFSATDSAEKIQSIQVAWNGSGVFTEANVAYGGAVSFTHVFTVGDTAIKAIRVRLIDKNGAIADSLWPIKIRLGKPVVDGFTPRRVWVNDTTTFAVAAHDTNGKIDSVMINWDEGADFTRSGRADALKHLYAVARAGIRQIRVIVKDTSGIYSDTARFPDTVSLGKPSITSFTSDTPPTGIFINDVIPFKVTTSDPNDSVVSISVDSGAGTFGPFIKMTDGLYSFTRMFNQSDVKTKKTLRVRVKDNDGILSDTASLACTIRLGAPVIKRVIGNDSLLWTADTLVCPYIPSSTISEILVDGSDTNGTIIQYTWNINNGVFITTSPSGTLRQTGGVENVHYPFKVTCMDNDSLTSDTLRFVLLSHQLPPLPVSNCVPSYNQQFIFWKGKDPEDGNETQYKILIKKGSELVPGDEFNPAYIASDFKAGNQYMNGSPNFDYVLQFRPSSSGVYYYQIIVKNSYGQISRSSGSPNFTQQ